ncbi:hypothetical protein [Nocardioides pinisoli]|uniref:Uncharacterized protein n=1 Tax=Nocardioides pinisoli TaxID=2950279 RepID=A0ABT1KYB4_9ACTN|nr:hypothetical protein [Nocardioides pinisoli]MCP3422732.1 hypothetical protein [Nocardioides pinisoli]
MTTELDKAPCADCVPEATETAGRSSVTGAPLRVVSVAHDPTCPYWRARSAADGGAAESVDVYGDGLVLHTVRDAL